jgi:hypothetical protein
LRADAAAAALRTVAFHEPDLAGALTAVALEPAAKRLVRSLPTALGCAKVASSDRIFVTSTGEGR